jgi:hypothetical protein
VDENEETQEFSKRDFLEAVKTHPVFAENLPEVKKGLLDRLANRTTIDPLLLDKQAVIEVTVGELKEALLTNPDHSQAATYRKAIEGFPDTMQVTVDRISLTALLENKELLVKEEIVGSQRIRTRSLGEIEGVKPVKT